MKRKIEWKMLLLVILAYAGLTMDLARHGENTGAFYPVQNILSSFRGFDFPRALLIPGLYLIFRQADRVRRKAGPWICGLSVFFAVQMLLGFSFSVEGSWNLLISVRDGQLVKTVMAGIGWYLVFSRLLRLAFHYLDQMKPVPDKADLQDAESLPAGFHPFLRYRRMLRKHPFLTPFCTLLILYLPHILISYPAMFMGDTWSEIVQAYPELGMTGTDFLDPERIIRPGVYINQNHPVFHTLVLHLFLQAGDSLLHSFNAGIFLYTLFQTALLLTAFSWAISTLSARDVSAGWLIALMAWAWLHPQIHNFIFLVTKDIPYAACFLLAGTAVFRFLTGENGRKTWTVLILSSLGMILFRNEGRLVVLASSLLIAIGNRHIRRAALCYAAAVAVLSVGVYNLLYPALGYTPGSVREVLSIPFQQTARFARENGEEVTEEEMQAIDAVLDYASLAENYNPLDADPVKETFRQEADSGDLRRFFRAWAGMMARRPETFFQSIIENYYQYLYPAKVRMGTYSYGWSAWMCHYTNEKIAGLGREFSLPGWSERIRYLSDSVMDAGLLNLPVLSGLMTPALYDWAVLILLCWIGSQSRGRRGVLAGLVLPSAVILVLLFFGPVNGFYGRYLLPVTASVPFTFLMLMVMRQKMDTENEKGKKGVFL